MYQYFKFRLNDTVQLRNENGHTYRIVGYRLERSFYPHQESTNVVYDLVRDFDGYRTDAEEEELLKVENASHENIVMYGKDLWGYLKPFKIQVFKPESSKAEIKVDKNRYIDELLDAYNDYKQLATIFDDNTFQQKAEEVLDKLRNASMFISEAN